MNNKKCFHIALNGLAVRENLRYDSTPVLMLYVHFLSCLFLDAFAKFRKSTVRFAMSLRLHGTTSTAQNFLNFDIWGFFRKAVEKIEFI